MRHLVLILALGALAACGADGAPLRPQVNPSVNLNASPASGVTLNTSLGMGVRLF